ncbi:hypothetical protein HRR83_001834 [Exophiala dermatitidis]|uniref:Sugar phosphate transporter domain-containing protein n=1 Tax=Exophiala dermatitidis TaxID=5970 RepID=A0AAN6F1K8_EXODE|nr:hypothetical protein HRR73_004965 [Exophiala dermatitidis]KAJ4523291.1 hypothetical protein HRR75_001692 [Exophiala dermatitidis]KAJ4526637.1 hypothetical protein HRR74_001837 [Exophiala dermatitidis]KAJ4532115.1 hypothetical protein HRR76_007114 [Exophiala dermatitidis]KAJ4546150.1 hypothetical protein HRR77_004687 [Exophiala dermatitidis]
MEKSASFSTEKQGSPGPNPGGRTTEKGSLDGKTIKWIIVNVAATVGIVYINKSIFSHPSFRQCQLSFVAFHFAITWITLYLASRPAVGAFTPVKTSLMDILPLTIAMGGNVVLQNLSLAHSSVVFYQIVRILLTPLTALMNLFIYGSRIPALAGLALVPACLGVGVVSYLEAVTKQHAVSASGTTLSATTMVGVVFGFAGVAISALYTVWVSAYYRKLKMSSVQLLLNQMPLGGLMLVVASYFTDTYPVWSQVTNRQWLMISASGICAMLINVSQFYIITHAGPVSSTVVGHMKTVMVIGLGWVVKHEMVGAESALGVSLAVLGIIGYSYALYLEQSRIQLPK